MVDVITGYSALLAALRKRVESRLRHVIGIDGNLCAGKSFLAEQLAADTGARVLSLDDFQLSKELGVSYAQRRDLAALARAMAPDSDEELLIVEGPCLLDVLSDAQQAADTVIYVKRMKLSGFCPDRDLFDDDVTVRQLIDRIASIVKNPGVRSARQDTIRYHKARRPHIHADILFLRQDG